MKNLLILFTILLSSTSFANQIEEELMPALLLESSKKDESLKKTESKFVFTFRNAAALKKGKKVMYSIDGEEGKQGLSEENSLELITTPGKHIFQFYYSSEYYEVYTDSLLIEKQHVNRYSVFLQYAEQMIMTEKPVIYLYPETDTTVEVKVDPAGKFTFTYPEYNDGWKFKASANGDLTFGEDTYNYLFWESSARYSIHSNGLAKGYLVRGDEATTFLKEKLTEAGLTSEEQSDFITYWAPRLAKNDQNFVRFEFNETCDRFAKLDITPKPDHVYRIYMLWYPTNQKNIPSEQIIQKVDRTGFTVVEWGGQDLTGTINRASTN